MPGAWAGWLAAASAPAAQLPPQPLPQPQPGMHPLHPLHPAPAHPLISQQVSDQRPGDTPNAQCWRHYGKVLCDALSMQGQV